MEHLACGWFILEGNHGWLTFHACLCFLPAVWLSLFRGVSLDLREKKTKVRGEVFFFAFFCFLSKRATPLPWACCVFLLECQHFFLFSFSRLGQHRNILRGKCVSCFLYVDVLIRRPVAFTYARRLIHAVSEQLSWHVQRSSRRGASPRLGFLLCPWPFIPLHGPLHRSLFSRESCM